MKIFSRPNMSRELAAGDHERRERQRVGDDDPLERREIDMCRSFSIVGSATFTTVLSSMIMNRPNDDGHERPPLAILLGENAVLSSELLVSVH